MTRQEMIEKADIIRSRDRFGAMTSEELSALSGTERILSIPIESNRSVRVYEIRPTEPLEKHCPMIINYHGGGFIKGRSDRDKRYCCFLAEQLHCLVWDVDYCLAPEEPFPAAVEEAFSIAAYVFEHAKQLDVDPDRIALAGHSAGGNLVAAALIKAGESRAFRPCAALIEYFPANQSVPATEKLTSELKNDPFWISRAQTETEYSRFYCRPREAMNPLCSPLLASVQALTAFPDSLIISAGKDTLMAETEQFAQRLIEAGVTVTQHRYSQSLHGFTVNRSEGWEAALKLHYEFFQQHFMK